jgi:ATP adenylyltransferase
MSDLQTAQQLWAPWRMEFIRAPKEKACFLCRIIREGPGQDAGNLVVHRNANCLLLMNRYPYTVGHLMVVPFRHQGTLGALTPAEVQEMMELTCLAERLLERVAGPDGFNMGINQGAAAGAGLKDHLHLHVVPRWEGDTNFMPVLGGVRVMPQALDEMYAALRAELAREGA